MDPIDSQPGKPVFNRIVTLKDTWSHKAGQPDSGKGSAATPQAATSEKKPDTRPQKKTKAEVRILTPEQEARIQRYQKDLDLSAEEALILAEDDSRSRFFEEALKTHDSPQAVANWILNELLRELKENAIDSLPFGPADLAQLVSLIDDETISGRIAKDVFGEMLTSGQKPREIVEAKGLKQISDPAVLQPIIDRIVAANPDNVARFKEGKGNVFGFFVGQVLKETGNKANPRLVNDMLQEKLKEIP
jgi:glutaminyl-tRNA synthetase